jgi:hypothetical protein
MIVATAHKLNAATLNSLTSMVGFAQAHPNHRAWTPVGEPRHSAASARAWSVLYCRRQDSQGETMAVVMQPHKLDIINIIDVFDCRSYMQMSCSGHLEMSCF